jgi:hypothetical protein
MTTIAMRWQQDKLDAAADGLALFLDIQVSL